MKWTRPASDALHPDLERAYRTTDYRVHPGRRTYIVRIGRKHPGLDRQLKYRPWAVITPCNPGSRLLPEAENRRRVRALKAEVESWCLEHWPAVNRDPAGKWPDEPGWLMIGVSIRDATSIGQEWGQLAIVTGKPGERARLAPCLSPSS